MKKSQGRILVIGVKKPAINVRNTMIKKAMKKAVKDYRSTFVSLGNA